MRKLLIPLLVATALTPVAAQARQDRSDDRSEVRSERSVQRAERSNAERPARAERSVNVERQVRAERAPRVERSVDADRPKRADRIERVERNARPDRTPPVDRDVQQTQQAQVPAPVQPVQNVPINQTRRGGLAGAFTQLGKDMIARGDHTNDGDHDHDGDHHWDKDWRHNHRYDWWSYRNHYRSLYHLGSYYDPYGWGYNRWSVGLSLWPSYYGSNYWLDDPWMYRLPPAYGPYRWVRYYDDALLVNIYTGQVADVVYNFFW